MKILLCVLLPLVTAQTEFGTSYLKNSQLCAQWTCLNDNLGLSDSLPRRADFERVLRSLLPAGAWQAAAGPALDACYGERPRRYANTCPGQALLHCAVDQLIQNCPDESLVSKDACAPVSCFAGFRYMFSQSRYNDLEKNLPLDRRPAWFLKNYFNVKCCDLPPLFNATVLHQCGFHSIIHYYNQQTKNHTPTNTFMVERKHNDKGELVKTVPYENIPTTPKVEEYGIYDPLDCCDIHEFISPTWRSHCGFQLVWDPEARLAISNTTGPTTTTTTTEAPKTLRAKDVKMVPYSCDKNNCVFRTLNVVSDSGAVDIDAFAKLLDKLTDKHPEWVKAKGRVLTKCLSRPIRDYDYGCEINKVLACTFDVLSENCPNSKSPDVCRHSGGAANNGVICQISSSKYRPKNRRQFCGVPNLVNYEILDQCKLNSLIDLEYVPETVFKTRGATNFASSTCQDSTPSTLCLMDKMGVLNKYSFMDYFRMKDRVRAFSHGQWLPYSDAYTAVFQSAPLYKQHCNSPRKLLNLLDSMLMTCPISKRRNSPQCNKLFSELANRLPSNGTLTDPLFKLLGNVFITNNHDIGHKRHKSEVRSNPMFDFGMFNSANAPPVETIDLRTERAVPLILLPVYQRIPFSQYNREHVMRSAPVPHLPSPSS